MKSSCRMTQYYHDVTPDYSFFWNLGRSMAIRIGLWDRHTHSVAEALEREDRYLAEEAGITANDHVLDAGCGVGGSAIYLARTFGCRVTGISLSAEQIKTARRNARRHGVDHLVTFLVADFHATGLPDESFDAVWAVESISHSDRKPLLLAELYRVLKSGGRLIGADYFSTRAVYDASISALRRRVFDGLYFQEFAFVPRFGNDLTANGFTDIDFYDVTPAALPSARHFDLLTRRWAWAAALLKRLGLRSRAQDLLARGLRVQFVALRDGIHQYRIFHAGKPLSDRSGTPRDGMRLTPVNEEVQAV
ncbi:MAG: class I SAM-dependent methyltransferase [Candidatus Omnitrophica bacterium]|nr:class I SAM-dependent methyltransferase [Candidatus Omnitrophota bacterium]MCB9720406.1 class I SAM-dependent methyltransferase [Candidatus Omnitrophota bacterium]